MAFSTTIHIACNAFYVLTIHTTYISCNYQYMQLLARIRWLTLFAIQHLTPITNSTTYTTIIPSSITYNILFYTIICIISCNKKSHCKILYSILLYQYYNIVNTCNHIVTIAADILYSYLNRYNYINSITKN